MKKMKLFFTAMMVLLASSAAMAQDVTVTGVVRDASTGEPVPFASIQIKGTLSGGSTDADGNYEILVSDDAVLVFTSIGYQAQEIAVDGRPQINVALEPDSEMLDETIVVAFGTTTKEAFTGSAKVLKSDGSLHPHQDVQDPPRLCMSGDTALSMQGIPRCGSLTACLMKATSTTSTPPTSRA